MHAPDFFCIAGDLPGLCPQRLAGRLAGQQHDTVVAGHIDMCLLVDLWVLAEPVVDAQFNGLILDHAAAGAPVVRDAYRGGGAPYHHRSAAAQHHEGRQQCAENQPKPVHCNILPFKYSVKTLSECVSVYPCSFSARSFRSRQDSRLASTTDSRSSHRFQSTAVEVKGVLQPLDAALRRTAFDAYDIEPCRLVPCPVSSQVAICAMDDAGLLAC